jgi:hypothetical protein
MQMDVSDIKHVLLMYMSTPYGPQLHLDVPTMQRPVLHLSINHKGLC